MVDNDIKAGHQAVERARAATKTDTLGPGVSGFTSSGAAYRSREIASQIGAPSPAETGFTNNNGLGYAITGEDGGFGEYPDAERTTEE